VSNSSASFRVSIRYQTVLKPSIKLFQKILIRPYLVDFVEFGNWHASCNLHLHKQENSLGEKIMTNEETITTLNNLIETCKDGQEGFKQSSEGVEDSALKSTFYEFSQHRATMAGELQQLVSDLGGNPEDSSSFAGSLHRGWINIKAAVTGQDETAILNEAERGEDVALSHYKDALEKELPKNVLETIQRQYTDVKAAHDKVKSLRNISRAASA